MGTIRLLDDHLINRIAAGEVVERPASVAKELLENSLDAGARSIRIALSQGGKRVVEVADDGCGMDRDDALLAIERHATSKLRRFDDLDAIATLGFRGEALPSIAAVSRFTLRTAARDGEGVEVFVRGGRIESVRDVASSRGTTIRVEGLFFNVPARRKFLRSEATELSHVLRLITPYALAHPHVQLRVEHDGRDILEALPVSDRAERVAQVHGSELARRLLPFEADADGIRARGFAGRPVDALSRRDAQHVFVNGRLVHDRMLSHAIAEAYGDTMPRGRFPAVLLFLELPPGAVDVNVHPQKSEVRFAASSTVHDFVREAVASALHRVEAVPTYRDLRPAGPTEAVLAFLDRAQDAPRYGEPVGRPAFVSPPLAVAEPPPSKDGVLGAEGPRRVQVLAQYRNSYVVAQDDEGLLLVDQHVAHERVLYERYLAAAEIDRVETQRLLFPLTVELEPHEMALLEDEAGEFRRLGFALEPFGARAYRLDAVPAVTAAREPAELFRKLLGEAARTRSVSVRDAGLRRALVTTAACHAAIKVNDPLPVPAMQGLLDDLFRTENPTTCPHGRPILFRLTLDEIERAFRRR